jgi:hypothetical protein
MDERDGATIARHRRLKVVGTLAALDLAAAHGLVDLQTMFDRLRATAFRSPRRLMVSMLEQDAERRKRQRDRQIADRGQTESGYNKGTIRADIRYLVVSIDVRRHRLISSDYIKTLYTPTIVHLLGKKIRRSGRLPFEKLPLRHPRRSAPTPRYRTWRLGLRLVLRSRSGREKVTAATRIGGIVARGLGT